MSRTVIKCGRCHRRMRNVGEWNVVMREGHIESYLCPRCQTPEENAGAEVNLATLDYLGPGPDGCFRGRPKADRHVAMPEGQNLGTAVIEGNGSD